MIMYIVEIGLIFPDTISKEQTMVREKVFSFFFYVPLFILFRRV